MIGTVLSNQFFYNHKEKTMKSKALNELIELMGGALEADETSVKVLDDALLRKNIVKLVEASALGKGVKAATARFLVRGAALEMGVWGLRSELRSGGREGAETRVSRVRVKHSA